MHCHDGFSSLITTIIVVASVVLVLLIILLVNTAYRIRRIVRDPHNVVFTALGRFYHERHQPRRRRVSVTELPPVSEDLATELPAESIRRGSATVFFQKVFHPHQQQVKTRPAPVKHNNAAAPATSIESATYAWEVSQDDVVMGLRLGEGTFSNVFAGDWLGVACAVKVPKPDSACRAALLREIAILSRLHHSNVVTFMGAKIRDLDLMLLLEVLPRGSVYDFIKQTQPHAVDNSNIVEKFDGQAEEVVPYTEALAHKFAIDTARGMKYLHERAGIVHGDLKSANLLLDSQYNVKVCDFGMASDEASPANQVPGFDMVGTPAWSAPEVVRGDAPVQQSDVYSFSIILWELITRKVPYEGQLDHAICHGVARGGLRPPIPLRGSILEGYRVLLKTCWEENLHERPPFTSILAMLFEMYKQNEQLKHW